MRQISPLNRFLLPAAVALVFLGVASAAHADGAALAQKECGACHLAYPPRFLPAASWRKIVDSLSDHFGEDASLSPDRTKIIRDYLVSHAGRPVAGAAPMRITERRWFVREHRRARRDLARVKTMSNCAACHEAAARGRFDDD